MNHPMPAVIEEHELFRACEIIFGTELHISRDFLEYLQPSGIKTAYRKRALETHPDRVAVHGNICSRQESQLFHAVQEAYESLMAYLEAREKGYRLPPGCSGPRKPAGSKAGPAPGRPSRFRQPSAAKESGKGRKPPETFTRTSTGHREKSNRRPVAEPATELKTFWPSDALYSGPIPNRRLLLGHYLYYSGLINWRTVVQALIWQRMKRPRLGELGRRYGMLTDEDILTILKKRPPLTPFGETAITLGLLSESQVGSLIFHQKRLQKKFGEFFVEKNILRPEELHRLIIKFQMHNASITGALHWGKTSS
jgi:hypothetical protein